MKEYMLIFRNEKAYGADSPSEAQMQAVLTDWQQWIAGLVTKGKYSGTNRLLPEGKVLKPGKPITDGPYVEAKELVGGYLIVKANSLDEAAELAKDCPNLKYGGNVEVRGLMPMEQDSKSANFLNSKAEA